MAIKIIVFVFLSLFFFFPSPELVTLCSRYPAELVTLRSPYIAEYNQTNNQTQKLNHICDVPRLKTRTTLEGIFDPLIKIYPCIG